MTKEQKSPEDIAHGIVSKWDKKNFTTNYIPVLTLIDLADKISKAIEAERESRVVGECKQETPLITKTRQNDISADGHLAMDWLQWGNEWDEVRANCTLRYILALKSSTNAIVWPSKCPHCGGDVCEKMAEALEDAYEVIHGEFCSQSHHPFCDKVSKALAEFRDATK